MTADDSLDVWVEENFAGSLHRGDSGEVEFVYDDAYASEAQTTPLSLSMPKAFPGHSPRVVEPWIENLLPENSETRKRWARHFGETKTDAFTLLRHVGADAPGAVQIVPAGQEPSAAGEYVEVTPREIAQRLEEIARTGGTWTPSEGEEIRFSLAGQQAKFALARVDDRWLEPSGRVASTHIVKPGMQSWLATGMDDQVVEFATMRAAARLRLPAAEVEIATFDGVPSFVTQRYDRVIRNGKVFRVHQEDCCQALGVSAEMKYESDGGPGVGELAGLIERSSSDVRADRIRFAEALAFNLVAAGIDAHAKNYSLLLRANQARLAPLYDLISAHGIVHPKVLAFKGKTAMRYGKEYRFKSIDGRNLVRTADSLGLDRTEFLGIVESVGERLPFAFDEALKGLSDVPVTQSVRDIPQLVSDFVGQLMRRINVNDLVVEREDKPASKQRVSEVWVPGHFELGKWVSGHFRPMGRARR